MMKKCKEMGLLGTLYQYQQAGHLCDVTVMSSEGKQYKAHAGVLAAASAELADELCQCSRGNYTIEMSLNSVETEAFIHFVYTGKQNMLKHCDSSKLEYLCDLNRTGSHEQLVISQLDEFADKGLFCNMACYGTAGEIQPCHSYVIAAKYEFMSDAIQTGSIVCVKGSVASSSDVNESHNSSSNQFNFFCTNCDKGFTRESSLASHECIQTSGKSFQCTTCHKRFKVKSRLQQHEITHTGDKPFMCEICYFCFKTLSSLNRHKHIHMEDKS